jgi:hypothetical protein
VLAVIVMRALEPMTALLAGFLGAVGGLLLGYLVVTRIHRRPGGAPPLSLWRFLLAFAMAMLMAAAAWEARAGSAAAALVGGLLGLMLAGALPAPRRRG